MRNDPHQRTGDRRRVWAWIGRRWRVAIALRTCRLRSREHVEVTYAGGRYVVPAAHLVDRPAENFLATRPTLTPDEMSAQTNLFLEAA